MRIKRVPGGLVVPAIHNAQAWWTAIPAITATNAQEPLDYVRS